MERPGRRYFMISSRGLDPFERYIPSQRNSRANWGHGHYLLSTCRFRHGFSSCPKLHSKPVREIFPENARRFTTFVFLLPLNRKGVR